MQISTSSGSYMQKKSNIHAGLSINFTPKKNKLFFFFFFWDFKPILSIRKKSMAAAGVTATPPGGGAADFKIQTIYSCLEIRTHSIE